MLSRYPSIVPRVEELALILLPAGVADHAGTPTGEGDRAVPGFLEPTKGAELEEVAHVEAVGADGSKPA